MEIISSGQSSFKIKGKKATAILSPEKLTVEQYEITGPGEYDVSGVNVIGLYSGAYEIIIDNVAICYFGKLNRKLTDGEKDRLGTVNIALVPAIDSFGNDLEPAYIIPYGSQEEINKFVKELGAEGIQPVLKLVTSVDKLPETTTVVVLNG